MDVHVGEIGESRYIIEKHGGEMGGTISEKLLIDKDVMSDHTYV
jgi:hypothetical protein